MNLRSRTVSAASTAAERTITASDDILLVDTAGGAVALNLKAAGLPGAPGNGFTVEVKDVSGQAASNPVTISVASGRKVEGVTDGTCEIDAAYGAVRLSRDGSGDYWRLS